MKEFSPKHIVVVGLGLIGGSMALDLQKAFGHARVFGIDANADHLVQAQHLGIIHETTTLAELALADLVLLAVPVDVLMTVTAQVLDLVSDTALVLDVGSTKAPLCKAITDHPKRHQFLATHPIAGTEYTGPKAAIHKLFDGKTCIICEVEKTAFIHQQKALAIMSAMGMRVRYMDPISHDKHIAYVSHLSHVSSFMLGKTVIEKEQNERDIFDMAGSGFASTVRLAKSSPAMWTPIFKQNKENVLETLSAYIDNLKQFQELLADDQYEALYATMENTNHIQQILNGLQ